MTDTATNQPIRVETDTKTGTISLIRLPVSQLEGVRALLDANNIPYWVGHLQISFDGGPYMAKIYLRRKADPRQVQTILDSAN